MHKTIVTAMFCGGLAASAIVLAQVRPETRAPRPVPAFPVPKVALPMEKQRGTLNIGQHEMKVVELGRVPDSALHIATWRGLSLERTAPAPPGGISSPGATIYVRKTWQGQVVSNIGFGCAETDDVLDFSEPRRHGFRVHEVIITQLPVPDAFGKSGPRRAYKQYVDAQGKPTGDPSQAVRILLNGGTYQFQALPTIPVTCFMGYRANISLYGPADIDPFTGNAIVRQQVN
ncbi:hypothetical protein [Sphingopyxis fribergensis]